MKNTIAVFSTLGVLLALSACATHSHVLRALIPREYWYGASSSIPATIG
jgi:hypothetical protein